MGAYDFYLRHGAVSGGEWLGFRLAWRGIGGVEALGARPHLRWRPWVLDPSSPGNVAAGAWAAWEWRFDVALLDGLAGLGGSLLDDGRAGGTMRADLLAYMDLPALQLQDVDGMVYTVKMTGYREQEIETYTGRHPTGGWLAQVEFAEVTTV